jgi:hypothetical protein
VFAATFAPARPEKNAFGPQDVLKLVVVKLRVAVPNQDLDSVFFQDRNEGHGRSNQLFLVHRNMLERILVNKLIILVPRSPLISSSVAMKISRGKGPAK